MPATYGQRIRWNTPSGSCEVSVSECATPEEALREAVKSAWASGWRPPRWWQAYRWSERPLPVGYEAHLPQEGAVSAA